MIISAQGRLFASKSSSRTQHPRGEALGFLCVVVMVTPGAVVSAMKVPPLPESPRQCVQLGRGTRGGERCPRGVPPLDFRPGVLSCPRAGAAAAGGLGFVSDSGDDSQAESSIMAIGAIRQ